VLSLRTREGVGLTVRLMSEGAAVVPDDDEAASGGGGEADRSSSSSRAYDSLHSLLMARSALYGEWYLQSVSEKLRRRNERDEADDGGGGTTEAEGKASASSSSSAAAAEWDRYISALAAGHVDNEDDGDMEFDERLMFGVASMAKAAREAAAGVGGGGGGGAAQAGAGAGASSAGRG
jgi:hypothetical protein